MLFTESFITDAGEMLLARAIAQEGRIVWTRAATSNLQSDKYQTSQMNALDESTFGTKTSSGVVTNAVVNDQQNTATLYSELTNEEYNGEARTYGAWAKIEGDVSDVLAIVARCGSGVTPTTVNPASAGVVKAFVDFELDITAEQAQAVQVSEGWYATQAALQDEIEAREALAGRVVTTHKAGDINSGDNQTILGKKTFNEKVTFESTVQSSRFIGDLMGRIPYYTGGIEKPPVGSIILIKVTRLTETQSAETIGAGEEITFGSRSDGNYNAETVFLVLDQTVYYHQTVMVTGTGHTLTGSYRTMNSMQFESQGSTSLAMVIRTE